MNRRQFERFAIPEDAIAHQDGKRLGRVIAAGGGGMTVCLDDAGVQFAIGQKVRITIVEPHANISHTIDAVVRHQHEQTVGFEFVTGKGA